MVSILSRIKKTIIKRPHFWALVVITLIIMFIYQAWPWRELNFTYGIWKWFPWLSSLKNLALFEFKYRFAGSLFILPIIYATIVYKWQGALIISPLSLTYSLLTVGIWATLDSILRNSTLILLPAAVIVAITIEMEIRRRDRRSLVAREEQRKVYLSKVYEAQENERRRLAQELHDDTIQTFLVIAKSAQNLTAANNGAKEEVGRNATYIKDTALQAIEDVRRLTFDLRPSILDDLGLLPALRWLVDRMNKESEIRTRMLISDTKSRLSPQAEITTFRIVQEALHNIKRHSKAKEAVITLEFSADALNMTIQDDGQGFIPPRKLSNLMAKGNLGLIGMQERIESINGKLKIHSKPSKGTLLSIKIPY